MEANLLMISEYTALETGNWLIWFVQYLTWGAGALCIGGVCAVLYENLSMLRKGTLHTDAAEIQGFGSAKKSAS